MRAEENSIFLDVVGTGEEVTVTNGGVAFKPETGAAADSKSCVAKENNGGRRGRAR